MLSRSANRTIEPLFDVDTTPLLAWLMDNERAFGLETWRQRMPYTPHGDSETVFLRMPPEATPRTVIESLDAADTDAFVPPFRDAANLIVHHAGGELGRAMVTRLKSGGVIKEHVDAGPYAMATQRYHLPIQTNPSAWLQVENDRHHMKCGTVYYLEKHRRHWGANDGDTPRTHLIVDVFPTERVTFATEKLHQWFNEGDAALFADQWREVASFPDERRMDINRAVYEEWERIGALLTITARRGGELIGYWTGLLTPEAHARTEIHAVTTSFYVKPGFRGYGLALYKRWRNAAKTAGARTAETRQKLRDNRPVNDAWRMFEALGLERSETVYRERL